MLSKKEVFHLNRTDEKTKKPSIFRGLILATLSGVFYSLVGAIVKHMQNLHPGQLAMYRLIAVFVMTMPEAVKTGQNPLGPRELRVLMVFRGLLEGLNAFMNFIAFRYLGLGEAMVIIFSAPVFVSIFARIFLKEPCYMYQSITVILTVIGIILTAKLPSRLTEVPIVYSSQKLYGLAAAVVTVFSWQAIPR